MLTGTSISHGGPITPLVFGDRVCAAIMPMSFVTRPISPPRLTGSPARQGRPEGPP